MLATNVSEAESAEEKLRWAFRLYDKDSSGSIDVKEMIEIVANLYEMEGISAVSQTLLENPETPPGFRTPRRRTQFGLSVLWTLMRMAT